MSEDSYTLVLSSYERDNLLAALEAAYTPGSPLQVLYTGDWLHQLLHKLAPNGIESDRGRPNVDAADLVDRARRQIRA